MCMCVEGKMCDSGIYSACCQPSTYKRKVDRGLVPLSQDCAEGEVLKPSSSEFFY